MTKRKLRKLMHKSGLFQYMYDDLHFHDLHHITAFKTDGNIKIKVTMIDDTIKEVESNEFKICKDGLFYKDEIIQKLDLTGRTQTKYIWTGIKLTKIKDIEFGGTYNA